jgi:hypothetical protein
MNFFIIAPLSQRVLFECITTGRVRRCDGLGYCPLRKN